MSTSSDEEDSGIVLDNGSHRIKAGFSGDDSPRSIFRTIVGTTFNEEARTYGKLPRHFCIGDEAIKNSLDIKKPIERGIVTNWEAMEAVWSHVFDDLRVKVSDHNVLLTEPQMNPLSNREKMAEVMFEKFQPLGLHVMSPTVLSLYASGRLSGLVIDSGFEVTSVSCIYEGHKVVQSIFRSDIGGNDVTHYLIELLGKRGYSFTTTKEIEDVSLLKERCAYVSRNPATENMENVRKGYTYSNGTSISVDYERFQCMEAMFNPSLIGSDLCGIHDLIIKSIQACPVNVRGDICRNIILSGSNTMVMDIATRIDLELKKVLPAEIKVVSPPERRSSTWIGGSVVASLSSVQDKWIRPSDYEEFGPNIVWRPQFTLFG
ncbi:uncharacterized protein [Argopecten irradians]|uniref:uncharacterized protein isoform X3 n=1 Tax=Argopecten irradians TaxID=31199 RepID=UPI00371AE67B